MDSNNDEEMKLYYSACEQYENLKMDGFEGIIVIEKPGEMKDYKTYIKWINVMITRESNKIKEKNMITDMYKMMCMMWKEVKPFYKSAVDEIVKQSENSNT